MNLCYGVQTAVNSIAKFLQENSQIITTNKLTLNIRQEGALIYLELIDQMICQSIILKNTKDKKHRKH